MNRTPATTALVRIAGLALAFALTFPFQAAGSPSSPASTVVRQGDPLTMAFEGTEGGIAVLRDESGAVRARAQLFVPPDRESARTRACVIPVGMDLPAGLYRGMPADWSPDDPRAIRVRVLEGVFVSEDIPLDAANTALRTVPDPRKDAEWLVLKAIYDRFDPSAVFLGERRFIVPVPGARRTAFFGDRRRYLYAGGGVGTSVHAGVDFAVPPETPVLASARGRVVFAEHRIVTGLTLVLEHLPGVYSVYMHLSSVLAERGAVVGRGTPVAKSGNTGLSTGPHLHWEVRVGGHPVNPDYFVANPALPESPSP